MKKLWDIMKDDFERFWIGSDAYHMRHCPLCSAPRPHTERTK